PAKKTSPSCVHYPVASRLSDSTEVLRRHRTGLLALIWIGSDPGCQSCTAKSRHTRTRIRWCHLRTMARTLATYHRWPAEQPLKRSGAQVVPPQMCCDDKYCRHGCADHISFEKGLGTGADQQRQYEQVSNIDGQRQPTS